MESTPVSLFKTKPVIIIGIAIVVIIIIWLIAQYGGVGGGQPTSLTNDFYGTSSPNQLTDINQVTEENAPTSSVPLATRKAAVVAFQSAYESITSGNAGKIRTLLSARANTPDEKKLLQSLADTDLVQLSARIAHTMPQPPLGILVDKTALWSTDRNMVSVVVTPVTGVTTTLSAVLINGKWY